MSVCLCVCVCICVYTILTKSILYFVVIVVVVCINILSSSLSSTCSSFRPYVFRPSVFLSFSFLFQRDKSRHIPFPTPRIAQASFRFLIFSPQKSPPARELHSSFQREMAAFFPFSSAHLQFSFSFRDAVTLSQIEIFPVWKMFSFARKSLDLFANEEGLKRLAVISLFQSKAGFCCWCEEAFVEGVLSSRD